MSLQQENSISKLKLMGAVGIALIIFLMWIEGAFVSKTSPGEQTEKSPTGELTTLTVGRENAEGAIAWPARVEALKTIQIASKFPGRILEIPVMTGAKVARGQRLVQLDSTETNSRLAQAKAQLKAAEAGFTRASAEAQRIRHLYEKEAATRQALETAAAEEHQSSANVMAAKATVSQMASEVSETTLLAPFDGVIERKLQEPGDLVLPGQPILTFLQSPTLRLEASLPSTCANNILVGESIKATVPGMETELTAIVEEKEPASDRETQTQRIKARLPEGTQITPGSFVWLQQGCGSESLILIPTALIKRIGQLESVTILKDGHLRTRHIRTGRTMGDQIEVISGLNEGEMIVKGAP
ncbi:MAG: hypothetical protein RL333_2144 [Pseudomonadota bacterium]